VLTSLSLFIDRFRLFKRDQKAKEARQKKIQAFWKKQAAKERDENLAKPEPEPTNLKKLEGEHPPEQAPVPDQVPADAEGTSPDAPAEEDGSQTPTEEPSPHNSTDDDDDEEDDASNGQPGHVMSEESKAVSLIEPPRKLQRNSESDPEQQQTGLLCGCI